MGTFSIWHWIIVLIIVALVFGTKKLRNLGSDLGSAIKGFKEGIKDSDNEGPAKSDQSVIEASASKDAATHAFKDSRSSTNGNSGQIADAEIKEKTTTKS